MSRTLLFSAIALATASTGCGGGAENPPAVTAIGDKKVTVNADLDEHPKILGITPKSRPEIRELIVQGDPQADADKVLAAYMQRLRKIADGHKIKPTAAGDYAFPPELEKGIDQYRAKGGVLESVKVLRDFDLDLPGWAQPLASEYETGTITDEREELLVAIVNVELASLIFELSR